jgi:Replication-relaxation
MSGMSHRYSRRVESGDEFPDGFFPSDNGSYSAAASSDRGRATGAYVRGLAPMLSGRDVSILRELGRVRCLTGRQIERLDVVGLTFGSQVRTRQRILKRFVALGLISTLSRRIGGIHAGSAGHVYMLDAAGQRLLRFLDGADDMPGRRPWETSERFLDHTLAVAELYVQLREAERSGELEILRFLAEPACWQPTATLGTLKPDAYVLLGRGGFEYAWWVEIDMGTESRTTCGVSSTTTCWLLKPG